AAAPVRQDPNFGLFVPQSCPEVPNEVLDPRRTWSDKQAYDETARGLTRRFAANFREYEPFVGSEVKEAAIRAAAKHFFPAARDTQGKTSPPGLKIGFPAP